MFAHHNGSQVTGVIMLSKLRRDRNLGRDGEMATKSRTPGSAFVQRPSAACKVKTGYLHGTFVSLVERWPALVVDSSRATI